MRAAGASIKNKRPRSSLERRGPSFFAIALALAAGLIALGAISPAFAQDEPPVGPSATIGALGAARMVPRAPEAPAAGPPAAAAAEEDVTLLHAAPAATAA